MTQQGRICQEIHLDPRGQQWSEAAREHVAKCRPCQAYLECCALLTERLKNLPSLREEIPASRRSDMERQLAEATDNGFAASRRVSAGQPGPSKRRFVLPIALAATLALGVIVGQRVEFRPVAPGAEVEATAGMFIADVTHDQFLLDHLGKPLEVAISDARDLSSWLSSALGFAVEVPPTQGPFKLQGGRIWHTIGRLSALASYTTQTGARVDLFVVPADDLVLQGAESQLIGKTRVFKGYGWGNEARVWIEGDLALALTAPEGELPTGWDEVFLP